jgi:hypothetical protein
MQTLLNKSKYPFIFLISTVLLSGCFTRRLQVLDKTQADLMPPEVAQSIISQRIQNFDKTKITIAGNASHCTPASKEITIDKLNSAFYGNNKYAQMSLVLRSDFSEFSLCNRMLRIQPITQFEARELVNALNSLGAQIPNLIVVTD